MINQYRTVQIQIYYTSIGNDGLRRGEFPLKGKKPEQVAYEFFRWIQKEMPYGAELDRVLCEGEDITEAVRSIEKGKPYDGLPF